MKKFVIFWMSFFDNEPHLEECYAWNEALALVEALRKLGFEVPPTNIDEDNLKELAFNSDCVIEALQIFGD